MKLARLALGVSLLFAPLLAAGSAGAMDIQRVVSPKGIVAWLVEENTVPIIAMEFAFMGGASQDPPGKAGVANLMSGLLDEGAGDLDSQAFQSALDEYSIGLSFDAGRDAFFGSMKTLAENRDEAVRLLRLAINSPRFDAEPVERIRAQIAAGIKGSERDPDTVAGNAIMAAAFPGHPYGLPKEGTLESLASITAADLKTFHDKTIARDNLKITVVGAIDAKTLAAVLDEVFGDLPVKANLVGVAETAPAGGAPVDVAMTIPQTVIQMVGRGLKRDDPDFIPASVAAYILGGGSFSSRLYDEIREKRGLAYSVYLGLVPLDHAGAYFVGTSTRADQASNVVGLIESEVKRFAEEGPTEKELADAKSYLIGSYPLRFDSSGDIASNLLGIQLDDLGIDYVDKRNDLIAAVTIDDVRRVAKRLFADDGRIVVRVGQPQT
ncbi:MAG TPA: pitrilysin family protein [Bauldia sp.]|mgnify:FL=1|nr:pitrilysin family protein [Bauldia sp.]